MPRWIAMLLTALLLTACAVRPATAPSVQLASLAEPPPTPVTHAVLLAAGDNLIHDVIYRQAAQRGGDGKPDFSSLYSRVAPLLAGADFAFINQETVLAGDKLPLSSYPRFCSPAQVGEQLVSMGFNLFSTANNHSYDMGETGLLASVDFWERQQDVAVAGSYRSAETRDAIETLTRGGITVALIAATEQTNGLSLPSDSEAGVLLLSDRERLLRMLKKAAEKSDLVVLSLHWGIEDSSAPTDAQRQLAQELAEAGADLILGHHSHVLQGGEMLKTARGHSYVAYSLGNFVSAQTRASNLAGGLLRVEISKGDGHAVIDAVTLLPTVTHYESGFAALTVIPMQDYTAAQAARHGVQRYDHGFSYERLTQQLQELNW